MSGRFDLRDVMLEAAAEVQEVLREVALEIAEPRIMEGLVKLWATLPEEMRARFAEEKPEEYRRLKDVLRGEM